MNNGMAMNHATIERMNNNKLHIKCLAINRQRLCSCLPFSIHFFPALIKSLIRPVGRI